MMVDSEPPKPAPKKLLNSLIEMCIVIGMDQDTGLMPGPSQAKRPQFQNSSHNSSALFNTNFTPEVIAALSGQVASFPHCDTDVDGEPFYQSSKVMGRTPVKSMVRKSRRSSITPNTGMTDLPVSTEVINSLPPLCLPDGGFVNQTKQEDSVHFLVLTDIEGNRTYCCCLTVHRLFGAKENESIPGYDLVHINDSNDRALLSSDYSLCYVPLSFCCISKYPYFRILKDTLSSLLPDLHRDPSSVRMALMQFVSHLSMIPAPPAGSLALEFCLNSVSHVIKPSEDPESRVVDMDLHLPFLCFSIGDILLIISCILSQQRLIFMSSRYSLLTIVIESIFTFIQPLTWSWTYVPVLPSNLLDLVEAPGAYIMGCHIRHKTQIETAMNNDEMADIIIADIDEGLVNMGRDVKVHRIPAYIGEFFKFRMKKAPIHFDLLLSNRPAFESLSEVKKERERFNRDFHQLVLAATMEMMARILGDMSSYTVQEELYFDLDAFIESKPSEDQPFYRELCKTHAFSSFLDSRLLHPEKRDYFAAVSEKLKPQPRPGPLRKRSSSSSRSPVLSVTDGIAVQSSSTESVQPTLILPPFTATGLHTGSFYDDCLAVLSGKIKEPELKSSSLLASYLYLRGMFNVARGNKIEALEDFFAVSRWNVQLFPHEVVREVVSSLSVAEEKELQSKSFYRKTSTMKQTRKEYERHGRERRKVVTSAVPTSPLGETEFLKRISMLQTTSADSGKKLFEALTLNKPNSVVDPDVFACFYEALSEADREAQAIPWWGITPEEGEFVVIASQVIRTDRAMGRLILTSNRLLFIVEGAYKCEMITRLEDIQDIEYYQHYVVLPPGVPALKITSRNKKVPQVIACLKENRPFWFACLKEMVAGVTISEESKDLQGIKQAAQNVMVADALRRSGHSEVGFGHVLYLSKIPITKKLSKETKRALEVRIDPTPQANSSEKTTVEAMVYAPETESCRGEVWCGLGSGAVAVIDAVSWKLVTQFRYAKDRVSCLVPVGDEHIWVGSMDTTIYIINRRTMQADQQLHGHADYISHMITTTADNGSVTVWSASLNGLIIGWDPDTLTAKKSLKMSNVQTLTYLIALGDYFWCVTRSSVLVVNIHSDGSSYEQLTLPTKSESPRSIDCMCAVPPNKVWTAIDRKGLVAIWDIATHEYEMVEIPCKGFTQMIHLEGKVWAGGRNGSLYVIDAETCRSERELELHSDRVRSMCLTSDLFILTGPGSKDGRIAVWRSHLVEDVVDAPGFEVVEESKIVRGVHS
ncbi:DENN domain-containing protein 3 [Nematostella vectensis]|uniref:DENN domain-containing protein 3 n=1 Tax=Nematostella vectensis TaxID=45351 RepID=UPI0020771621|nr:DENN domain-containing protein 3 [Nematostella vectensis]XP_048583739.1 DENN domain-containing protein 3 [Nematostella vectensis]